MAKPIVNSWNESTEEAVSTRTVKELKELLEKQNTRKSEVGVLDIDLKVSYHSNILRHVYLRHIYKLTEFLFVYFVLIFFKIKPLF